LVAAALEAALAAASRSPVFAISALQGSGKSTLAAQIATLAAHRGVTAAVLSIDDFYLPRARRRALAREVHPLLATRGPPGTHELALALDTLDRLREGRPVRLPRFDKLADEREPPARWPSVPGAVDVVILEGWFLKTPAQAATALALPINPLERDQDRDGTWRAWCNAALARDYPALWERIDALWVLQAPDFDVVRRWRWQQEQSLQDSRPGEAGMDRAQVESFVQLFERVSRQALQCLPDIAERTVRLGPEREVSVEE
jgi:D-glycerate 3-kinase